MSRSQNFLCTLFPPPSTGLPELDLFYIGTLDSKRLS